MVKQSGSGGSGKKVNKSFTKDSLQMFINFVVPVGVRKILSMVPDATYEKYVANVQKYWDDALPFAAFGILRAFNAPYIIDDLTTEILAELKRAMDERTKNGSEGKKDDAKSDDFEKIIILATELDQLNLMIFLDMLSAITDKKQANKFANHLLPRKNGAATVNAWTDLDQARFQGVVDFIVPPHVETKLEKTIKEVTDDISQGAQKSLDKFGEDAKNYFQKKNWLVRLAERKTGKIIN